MMTTEEIGKTACVCEFAIDIADMDTVGEVGEVSGAGEALTLAIVYVPFRIDDKTSV